MFASLFLVGGAGRRCVAILNDNGAIWTPWLVLVGARPARHTGGVIVRVRSVSDWARLAFHGARVGSLSRGTLRGIGGMQQQLAQKMFDTQTANVAAMENAPFQRLSAGAGIMGQLLPGGAGTQVVAPFAQTNPYAQAAGLRASRFCGMDAHVPIQEETTLGDF